MQKSFAGAELRLYGTNGSGNLDTSGVFGGINFQQESAMLPGVMPLSLFSQRDRTRAENILKDHQKKLQVIRKAFIASFGQYFAPEIENSTTVQNFTSSRIVIRTGGEKFSFYNDENRKALQKYSEEIKEKQWIKCLGYLGDELRHWYPEVTYDCWR